MDTMTTALKIMTAVAIALTALATPARGQDFCEDGDAGSLPGSSQAVTGIGAAHRIHGTTSSTGPIPDLEDMYLINIVDPLGFSATVTTDDPGTDHAAQLWLFAGRSLASFPADIGLLGSNGRDLPFIGAEIGNQSTDGTMINLTEAGLYYVAISGQDMVPGGDGRRPQSVGLDIFQFGAMSEVSGPDGPGGFLGGGTGVIDGWGGEGETGSYTINLTGVEFLPPVPTPGAVALLALAAMRPRRRR
jgi:hypothetical protein